MVRSSQLSARLPGWPSERVVVRRLQAVSTPELAAELYRRLCRGPDGEPGAYNGTILALCLEFLFEEPTAQGDADTRHR